MPPGKSCTARFLRCNLIRTSVMCAVLDCFLASSSLRAKLFEPFPKEQNIAEKIRQACLEEGVLTYPTQGCIDGLRGDHILLAPPFTISSEECALIARALQSAAAKVFST